MLSRRQFSFLSCGLICRAAAPARRTVRIGVFGLFHPRAVTVQALDPLIIQSAQGLELLQSPAPRTLNARALVSGLDHIPARFVLSLPGQITREYVGSCAVQPSATGIQIIVEMDLETAVASVAACEIPPSFPRNALEAQAVVARSFLVASPPRHRGFDFCDTTHCQFLRNPPSHGSNPAQAAEGTRGQVLAYRDRPIVALYSAACGGRTLTADGPDGFPYQSVSCGYCSSHRDEPVRGHRIGMCQQGAFAMAERGATFRDILNHYYPGTAVNEMA